MNWLQVIMTETAKAGFGAILDEAHKRLLSECGIKPGYGLKPSLGMLAAEAFLKEFEESNDKVLLAKIPAPGGPVMVTVSGYDDQALVMHSTDLYLDRRDLPASLLGCFLRRNAGTVRWLFLPSQGKDNPTVAATLPVAGLTKESLRAAGFAVAREAAELRAELRQAGLLTK